MVPSMNEPPQNAIQIEYDSSSDLGVPMSALFFVRNHQVTPEWRSFIKEMGTTVFKGDQRKYLLPRPGQFLACFRGGVWNRVYVIDYQHGPRMRVFFIDYGRCDDVPCSRLCQPLPNEFRPPYVESQSYKITLCNVIPIIEEIPLVQNSAGPLKKPCVEWKPCHVDFMKKEMASAERIFFQRVFQEGEIQFGYIFIEGNDGMISELGEILIENGMAVRCSDDKFKNCMIPFLINMFRAEYTFDQKLSVRKKLWPRASFKFERGDWLCSNQNENPVRSTSRQSSTFSSCQSNYSSYSNGSIVSVDDLPPESCSTPIKNVETSPITISNQTDTTSEYGSGTDTPKNTYPDHRNVLKMPKFTRMLDEIFMVGCDGCFEPQASFNSMLDDTTRAMIEKIGVRDINLNQSFMIPAMLSKAKKEVILVDAPKSGKTVGCLIALVSLLRETLKDKRPGISPRAIYVLPYSTRCEFARNRLAELIAGKKGCYDDSIYQCDLRVTSAYGSGRTLEHNKLLELQQGYDILVCTPRCLVRLLQRQQSFNLDRLEYAVFDEYHILRQSFGGEINVILDRIRTVRMKRVRQVFISNTSSDVKQKILDTKQTMNDKRMLLIPCFLEAALFVRFVFEIRYTTNARKILDEISGRMVTDWRSKIVVIIMSDDKKTLETMCEMKSALSGFEKPVYVLKPASTMADMDDIIYTFENDIENGMKPVIICSDSVLSAMNEKIHQADCLVHYSLPPDMGTFRERFSVILKRVKNIADRISEPKLSSTEKPDVLLYINENSMEQFPRLLSIMSQLIIDIPPPIQDILQKIANERERDRSEVCINLKQFGKCGYSKTCGQRHMFLAGKDEPDPLLPRNGQIKMDIVHVYNPTRFRVRLLQRRSEDGEWTRIPIMASSTLAMKMKLYYDKNKPVSVEHVKEGDLLGIQDIEATSTTPVCRRVRVIKIVDGKPKKAQLKFVDTGKEVTKKVAALFELPAELASIPETTFDVFLCNIQPIDEDITWGTKFCEIMRRKIFEKKDQENISFIGKIQLVVGRDIWVDPLVCKGYLEAMKLERIEFYFSNFLVQEGLAIRNENHLRILRQKCDDAGLSYSETGGDANVNVSVDSVSPVCETTANHLRVLPQKCDDAGSSHSEKSGEANVNVFVGRISPVCETTANHLPLLPQKCDDAGSSHSEKSGEANVEISVNKVSSVCKTTVNKNSVIEEAETSAGNNNGRTNGQVSRNITPASESTSNGTADNTQGTSNGFESTSNSRNGRSPPFKKPSKPAPKRRQAEGETRKPILYWSQDERSLTLVIRKNVKEDYTVTHSHSRRIRFEGTEGETRYGFDEELSRHFVPDTLRHKKSGVTIVIKVDKLAKAEEWKRLLKRKDRVNWVREDLERLSQSDDDSDRPVPDEYSTVAYPSQNSSGRNIESLLHYRPIPDDLSQSSSDANSDWEDIPHD